MSDAAFEAMCEVCNIDWQTGMTADQRGRVNAALKQLRAIYADDHALPQMIVERAVAFREVYPEIAVTPQAITGMWSSILTTAEQMRARAVREDAKREAANRRVTNAPTTTHGCICGGDHMVIVGTRDGHDLAAPCPECGTDNASYYVQGKLIRVMDKGEVGEMMGQ